MQQLNPKLFFGFEDLPHYSLFDKNSMRSWLGASFEKNLQQYLRSLGVEDKPVVRGQVSSSAVIEGQVFIDDGARVEPHSYIKGPCYIGKDSEVRHGAYIRGVVFVGQNCVVGHTTEVKSSIFLDRAKAGHFAYVGDSVLGEDVNLGAGTKLANFKLTSGTVSYIDPESGLRVDSQLRKFGAVIGDSAQLGCNSVLSPGTLLFPKTAVLPCVHFRGTLKKGLARSSVS